MIADYDDKKEAFNDSRNLDYSLENFKRFFDYYLQSNDAFALCLADIGNFKIYNYLYGYKYGDTLLNIAFQYIQSCIGNQGYVYRFRGDVLLIILHTIKCKSEAEEIIGKIEETFKNPIEIRGQKIRMTVKFGISLFNERCKDAELALKNTEIALHYAKKSYADKHIFFSSDMYEEVIRNGKLEIDILNAIHNNEFLLYFQPQVNANKMNVYGMEALLRWNHKEYGILPPAYFIDIIEQNGMINEIGKMVLAASCQELKRCSELGYNNLSLSVNISEKQLEDDSFSQYVFKVLEETEVDSELLTIEITERILVDPSEKILNTLSTLRSRGVKIYIDDFGTKYSSLNYLYCFPTDGIKIDKSFIDRVTNSERDLIITKNIVKLAKELNIEVVAEGVEREEQLDWLKTIECYKIQGFIFGKPVDSNKFHDILNKFNVRRQVCFN